MRVRSAVLALVLVVPSLVTAQQPSSPRTLLRGAQLTPASLPPTATFEVASVKKSTSTLRVPSKWLTVSPGGRFEALNVSLIDLLLQTYDVREFSLRGITNAQRIDRYDIVANTGGTIIDADVRTMMRNVLADRLKLSLRIERQEVPAQALVFAGSDRRIGPNLRRLPAGSDCRNFVPVRDAQTIVPAGRVGLGGGSSCGGMSRVAQRFEVDFEMPVIDQTGLDGEWSASIYYANERGTTPPDPNLPSLSAALREQWGMKLQATRAPLDVITIVSVQPPVENP